MDGRTPKQAADLTYARQTVIIARHLLPTGQTDDGSTFAKATADKRWPAGSSGGLPGNEEPVDLVDLQEIGGGPSAIDRSSGMVAIDYTNVTRRRSSGPSGIQHDGWIVEDRSARVGLSQCLGSADA